MYSDQDFEKINGRYRTDTKRIIQQLFNTPPFSEYQQYFNAYIVYINPEEDGLFEDLPESVVRDLFPEFDEQYDMVLISILNQSAGGVAGGRVASFPFNNKDIMIHEVGHLAGNLGDEYYFDENDYITESSICYNNEYPNIDLTNDFNIIKWSHFIGLEGYESVGAVEGGCGFELGTWRPTDNCVMRHGSQFCAPCREAIVKQTLSAVGSEYSFEQFLLND